MMDGSWRGRSSRALGVLCLVGRSPMLVGMRAIPPDLRPWKTRSASASIFGSPMLWILNSGFFAEESRKDGCLLSLYSSNQLD